MAEKPISTPLPADLPTNWQTGQTVSPTGTEVGLTQRHGYNYQAQQINNAQTAINTINDAFENVYGDGDTVPVADGGTGAKTPQEALVNLGAASNPNLLDNWYFVGGGSQQSGGQFPINQRGQTSYSNSGDSIIMSIDRWKFNPDNDAAVITINSDSVRMQKNGAANWPSINQSIPISEITNGETYTISVLSRGTAKWRLSFFYNNYSSNDNSQTWDGSGSQISLHTFTAKIQITTGDIIVVSLIIDGSSAQGEYLDIIAAKLELGPVQTLAHQDADGNWVLNDPPPNFQQELAKCQRYAIALKGFAWIGMGVMNSATDGQFFIPFPVSIRSLPAFSGSLHVYNSTNNISATVKGITGFNANGVNGTFSVASGTFSEKDFVIVFLDPGESCLFSADL